MSPEPTRPHPFQKAAVVGLGVVGIPVAAKLAEAGIRTVGLDVARERVDAVAAGRYPFDAEEPGMEDLLATVHAAGTLHATVDATEAITDADAVIVVVQTPVEDDGHPRYEALTAALRSVGAHLKRGALVVVESTIAPGTMRAVVQPTLEEASGTRAGEGFLLGHCPERVMPGKLLQNITHYDRVVGGFDQASTERMLALYGTYVHGELTPSDMTTAEVVKTTENAYRDVQIAFANEVALICEGLGVDVWEVRELVNKVEARNFHLPGVGVGGHCIPKDGLLLAHGAAGRFTPIMLRAAREVNDAMPAATARRVADALALATGQPADQVLAGRKVTILGASYLPGSDDTRLSPSWPLLQALEAAGAKVTLADPHADRLEDRATERDLDKALAGADAAVLATAHPAYVTPDWNGWKDLMHTPVVVDGRGAWNPAAARDAGFTYLGIGR